MDSRAADTARRAVLALLLALVAMVLAVAPAPWLLPTAHADSKPCAAQQAAVDGDIQAIDEHNSRGTPEGAAPPSVAIPYNQEADALNAKKDADIAKRNSCKAAVSRLTDKGQPLLKITDQNLNKIEQARRPGWQPPNTLLKNPINKDVIVPRDSPARPLYDVLRPLSPGRNFPNVPLRGEARPHPGEPSSARPGQVIGEKKDGDPYVSPDHIVPLAEIIQLPRFMDLNAYNIWLIVNARFNLQCLDTEVNVAKGSKSIGEMENVSGAWKDVHAQLQEENRRELIELIAQLADSQMD